jgi:hypothetical protein
VHRRTKRDRLKVAAQYRLGADASVRGISSKPRRGGRPAPVGWIVAIAALLSVASDAIPQEAARLGDGLWQSVRPIS